MNDIQNRINEAYKLISTINVSGDAVDVMAAARIHLKEAFELAADKEKEEVVNDG